MKNIKSHFWYNKSQRNGILFLGIFIILLQYIYFFVDFSSEKIEELNTSELISFQSKIDSLKLIELENRKPKMYPFNPSFITNYKGYKLGMTTQEIDKLLTFRKAGNYINSAEQFKQVTGIKDSLLYAIKPFFKFPEWVNKKKNHLPALSTNWQDSQNKELNKVTIKDLNKVNAEALKSVYGIGDKLSAKIIKTRNTIGGFQFIDQLNEVYGLKPEVIVKLLKQFQILSKPKITKLNINEATFKQILHLPYIDYELTKKIFDYKDEFAEFQDLKELKEIEAFPIDKYDRIVLYLTTEY